MASVCEYVFDILKFIESLFKETGYHYKCQVKKNELGSPVSLELRGKSPLVVGKEED